MSRATSAPVRHLAAVWFADIVGYTRLAAENERAALRLVEVFEAVAQAETARQGGRVIKFIGDGALAEFTSTEAAVRAALVLRDTFAERSAADATASTLRIGVHVGDVVQRADGDVHGDGVNIASRLQTEAAPGQVVVSEDVWHQLRQHPEYHFEALGERELRGVDARIRVFEIAGVDPVEVTEAQVPEHGLGLVAPAERGGVSRWSPGGRGWPRRSVLYGGLAGLAVLLVAGLLFSRAYRSPTEEPARSAPGSQPALAAERMIAVLPFENLSRDPENDYFSDGVTEEILTTLANVRELTVISRTSVMQYKHTTKSLKQIASELGVGTILEGSVRRVKDRVRISAQLIDARTDTHLWAEDYDRELKDIFAVQSDIAEQIAHALQARLSAGERARMDRPPTADMEAHDLYLQGRHYWRQRTVEGFRRAIESFQEAIARDPGYALAYVGLGDVYSLLGSEIYGLQPPRDAMPRAKEALARALELDRNSAEAHATLGNVRALYDRNWRAAEREFNRAIELNPGYAPAWHWYALEQVAVGRPKQALSRVRRASELEPLSPVMTAGTGRVLYYTRQYDRAVDEFRRALGMDSSFVPARLGLGLAYEQQGEPGRAIAEYEAARRVLKSDQPVVMALLAHAHAASGHPEEARALLARLEAAATQRYVPSEYLALIHVGLGEHDRAIAELRRAFANRSGSMIFLRVEPLFDPLRSDPRFVELERQTGL